MLEVKAPQKIDSSKYHPKIFLAGSIEQGKAIEWQKEIVEKIKDVPELKNALFYNPRRDEWDDTWEQTLENEQFVEQVNWELNALDDSDIILLVFDKETQSPISLLELGLHAKERKLFVCCPEEFWRSGNVYITCKKYGIPYVKTMDEMVAKLKSS